MNLSRSTIIGIVSGAVAFTLLVGGGIAYGLRNQNPDDPSVKRVSGKGRLPDPDITPGDTLPTVPLDAGAIKKGNQGDFLLPSPLECKVLFETGTAKTVLDPFMLKCSDGYLIIGGQSTIAIQTEPTVQDRFCWVFRESSGFETAFDTQGIRICPKNNFAAVYGSIPEDVKTVPEEVDATSFLIRFEQTTGQPNIKYLGKDSADNMLTLLDANKDAIIFEAVPASNTLVSTASAAEVKVYQGETEVKVNDIISTADEKAFWVYWSRSLRPSHCLSTLLTLSSTNSKDALDFTENTTAVKKSQAFRLERNCDIAYQLVSLIEGSQNYCVSMEGAKFKVGKSPNCCSVKLVRALPDAIIQKLNPPKQFGL